MISRYLYISLIPIFLLTSTIQAQVGVKRELPKEDSNKKVIVSDDMNIERILDVDGNLRIAEVHSALSPTTVRLSVEEEQKMLNRKDFNRVLVVDDQGKVDHIPIDDFYAFNYHQARYKTVTATYSIDKFHVTGEKKGQLIRHEDLVPGTVLSIGYLDFGVQYIEDHGSWLEVKFKGNEKNLDSNGKQRPISMVSTWTHGSGADIGYYTYKYSSTQLAAWIFTTYGLVGTYYGRISRINSDVSNKVANITFCRTDDAGEIDCYMLDVYLTLHEGERTVKGPNGSTKTEEYHYLSVSYWIVQPVKSY